MKTQLAPLESGPQWLELARLKTQWEEWNAGMLPITDDVRTYGISSKVQADHYRGQVSEER